MDLEITPIQRKMLLKELLIVKFSIWTWYTNSKHINSIHKKNSAQSQAYSKLSINAKWKEFTYFFHFLENAYELFIDG